MIIDSHNHMGKRKGVDFPAESMIEWMDKAGVDACLVTSQVEAINNDYIAEMQLKFENRIFGYAVVNPWDYIAEEELERCFRDLNLYGLKLNPLRHGFALDRHSIVDPLFEICERYDKPILVHGQSDMFNMPGKFDEMAETFPNVKIILAHIGEPDAIDTAIRVVNRRENVYVDTAGIQLSTLKRAVNEIDPNKILMGTDAPWGDFNLSIELVEKATEDEEIRQKILGKNAARLFKLPINND